MGASVAAAPYVVPIVTTVAAGFIARQGARKQGRAEAAYYNTLADRIESAPVRPFVAPFIPNYSFVQQAAMTTAMGALAEKRGAFEQKQFKAKANEAEALTQREAIEERRQGAILSSGALASVVGGGGTSEDVIDIRTDIETDAEYNALSRLWEGQTAADDLRFQGRMAKWQGQVDHIVAKHNASQIMAEGQYANELGMRQNQAAMADYQQYLSDRQLRIDELRLLGGKSISDGNAAGNAALTSSVVTASGRGFGAIKGRIGGYRPPPGPHR